MGLGILNSLQRAFKGREQIGGPLPYLTVTSLFCSRKEKNLVICSLSSDDQSVEMLILYLNRKFPCTGGSAICCYVEAVCMEWWRTCQTEDLEPLWFTTSWPELRWETVVIHRGRTLQFRRILRRFRSEPPQVCVPDAYNTILIEKPEVAQLTEFPALYTTR